MVRITFHVINLFIFVAKEDKANVVLLVSINLKNYYYCCVDCVINFHLWQIPRIHSIALSIKMLTLDVDRASSYSISTININQSIETILIFGTTEKEKWAKTKPLGAIRHHHCFSTVGECVCVCVLHRKRNVQGK